MGVKPIRKGIVMKRPFVMFLMLFINLIFYLMLPFVCLGDFHVTFLHFNDVYEITPVSGGAEGGLARVSTLYKKLHKENPNTISVLGGDFFSPSAMGTAVYKGDSLAGKQMVDVLNAMGLQYATFGNHEFDIKESQFKSRMAEAEFAWISSNVFGSDGKPFSGVKESVILEFTDNDSEKTFKVGIFGITLPVNKPDYVEYADPMEIAAEQIAKLKDKCDFLIALTHQNINSDEKLLTLYEEIDLLLGGHEHVNYQRWRGGFTPLLKADANVRSVYVVDLRFNPDSGKTVIVPQLVPINDTIAEDPEVKTVVDKWTKIAFNSFLSQGLNPEEEITKTDEPLNGLESDVRTGTTNLTSLIAKSMLIPYPDADLSIYNSGSIRIDDVIPVGMVTVYDVIRIVPFGGKVLKAEIKGSLLKKVLDQGNTNYGSGGYLQYAKVLRSNRGGWIINDIPIDINKTYVISILDFLASGKEQNLEFLNPSAEGFKVIKDGKGKDIRKLIIDEMKSGLVQ